MKKILIIEKIHESAIKLLKNRKEFSYEIVENLEKSGKKEKELLLFQ